MLVDRIVSQYGLIGEHSRDLLSVGGYVIAHDNERELAFLFPNSKVAPIPDSHTLRIPLSMVSGMEAVEFPLRREDFPNDR